MPVHNASAWHVQVTHLQASLPRVESLYRVDHFHLNAFRSEISPYVNQLERAQIREVRARHLRVTMSKV